MKIAAQLSLILLLALPATLISQSTAPSAAVAIEPCSTWYGGYLAANVPWHGKIRGLCGVPPEANAVILHLKAWGFPYVGKAYLWPYGGSFPGYSQFNWREEQVPHNPWSGHALVRLCSQPTCDYDISVQATANTHFALVIEGYLIPLAP